MYKLEKILEKMILFLWSENDSKSQLVMPSSWEEKLLLWRGLINQRQPLPISESYLVLEDYFLECYQAKHDKVTIEMCQKTKLANILTFHGDIRFLEVDAIVNAANSDMLGCFIPNHHCIDNAIHTFAGVRLRLKCHDIMTKQGHKEPIGQAKITPAFHLPSNYIIHTVGPSIKNNQTPSAIRKDLLRKSYLSCLKMASENNVKSIAFCGISTGQFGFPKQMASEIAVDTVFQWMQDNNQELTVIFNTFTDEDRLYYQQLLN